MTAPHLIERFKVDSSSILSAGFEDGVCVIEFVNGNLHAYDMPEDQWIAFAQSESKGRYFNQQIRGKISGRKLTGRCGKCGSEPEILGLACSDCGAEMIRAIDTTHKPR